MTTHAIDHLVSDPDWTLLFDGALALSAVTLLLAIVHPRVPSWAREVAEWALGLTWTVTASVSHVLGLIVGGPDPTDHTGILAAVGASSSCSPPVVPGRSGSLRRSGCHPEPVMSGGRGRIDRPREAV